MHPLEIVSQRFAELSERLATVEHSIDQLTKTTVANTLACTQANEAASSFANAVDSVSLQNAMKESEHETIIKITTSRKLAESIILLKTESMIQQMHDKFDKMLADFKFDIEMLALQQAALKEVVDANCNDANVVVDEIVADIVDADVVANVDVDASLATLDDSANLDLVLVNDNTSNTSGHVDLEIEIEIDNNNNNA